MAGDGAALELLAVQAGQEVHEVVAGNRFQGEFAFFAKTSNLSMSRPIRGNRIGRQALLHANVGKEGGDCGRNFHHEPANSSAVSRRMAMP